MKKLGDNGTNKSIMNASLAFLCLFVLTSCFPNEQALLDSVSCVENQKRTIGYSGLLSTLSDELTSDTTIVPNLNRYFKAVSRLLEKNKSEHGSALPLSRFSISSLQRMSHYPELDGIRRKDRVDKGFNIMHDQTLLHSMYAFSNLTADSGLKTKADNIISLFLEDAPHPETHLFPWGEHMNWNFIQGRPGGNGVHEFFGPFYLWEKFYEKNPQKTSLYAESLWEYQIGDKETGRFSRHASYASLEPTSGHEYPRHGGFYIQTWTKAYEHSNNMEFLEYSNKILNYYYSEIEKLGHIPFSSMEKDRIQETSNLALSVMINHSLPLFCNHVDVHTLDVIIKAADRSYLETMYPIPDADYISKFSKGYGSISTARAAVLALTRYEQGGDKKFLSIAKNTANYYSIDDFMGQELFPILISDLIRLNNRLFLITGNQDYLYSSKDLISFSFQSFFKNEENFFPSATTESMHFESITGGHNLMLSITEYAMILDEDYRYEAIGIPYLNM